MSAHMKSALEDRSFIIRRENEQLDQHFIKMKGVVAKDVKLLKSEKIQILELAQHGISTYSLLMHSKLTDKEQRENLRYGFSRESSSRFFFSKILEEEKDQWETDNWESFVNSRIRQVAPILDFFKSDLNPKKPNRPVNLDQSKQWMVLIAGDLKGPNSLKILKEAFARFKKAEADRIADDAAKAAKTIIDDLESAEVKILKQEWIIERLTQGMDAAQVIAEADSMTFKPEPVDDSITSDDEDADVIYPFGDPSDTTPRPARKATGMVFGAVVVGTIPEELKAKIEGEAPVVVLTYERSAGTLQQYPPAVSEEALALIDARMQE